MLNAECTLRTGKQKHWILRRVLHARWNGRAGADGCRKIQDVAFARSVDDVDVAAIATRQIDARTVAAGGHRHTKAGSRAEGVVRRKSRNSKRTFDRIVLHLVPRTPRP